MATSTSITGLQSPMGQVDRDNAYEVLWSKYSNMRSGDVVFLNEYSLLPVTSLGAVDPTGVLDSTSALKEAVIEGFGLWFPRGTYLVSGLDFAHLTTTVVMMAEPGTATIVLSHGLNDNVIQVIGGSGHYFSGLSLIGTKFNGGSSNLVAPGALFASSMAYGVGNTVQVASTGALQTAGQTYDPTSIVYICLIAYTSGAGLTSINPDVALGRWALAANPPYQNFYANDLSFTTRCGIYLDQCANSTVIQCSISQCSYSAINVGSGAANPAILTSGATNISVRYNILFNCTNGTQGNVQTTCTFSFNSVTNMSAYGILCDANSARAIIANNIFSGLGTSVANYGVAIYLYGMNSSVLVDNYISATSGASYVVGVLVHNASYQTIICNSTIVYPLTGIQFAAQSDRAIVSGNIITNVDGVGIYNSDNSVAGSKEVIIADNIITRSTPTQTTTNGIQFNLTKANLISNNIALGGSSTSLTGAKSDILANNGASYCLINSNVVENLEINDSSNLLLQGNNILGTSAKFIQTGTSNSNFFSSNQPFQASTSAFAGTGNTVTPNLDSGTLAAAGTATNFAASRYFSYIPTAYGGDAVTTYYIPAMTVAW